MKFPSHKETLEFIRELDKIEWHKYKGENIAEYLEKNHKLITNISELQSHFYLRPFKTLPIEFKLFRIRRASEIKNKFLRCEYSYPPIEHAKNLRANLKHFPAFYASDNWQTALLEYIQQWQDKNTYKNEKYVISVWSIQDYLNISIASFFPANLDKQNAYTQFSQFTNEEFRKKTKNNLSDDVINGLREMKEYFSKQFLKDQEYSISSYLSFKTMYENPLYNTIILYPSKQTDFNTTNFAISPNFVDEKMKLERVYQMRVNDISKVNETKMSFNTTVYGELILNVHSELKLIDANKSDENKALFERMYKEDLFMSE